MSELPAGPIDVDDLHGLPEAERALPVIVGEARETLAIAAFYADRSVLYGYSPWNGWQVVDERDRDGESDIDDEWAGLVDGAFSDPTPDCMRLVEDVEAARELVESSRETA